MGASAAVVVYKYRLSPYTAHSVHTGNGQGRQDKTRRARVTRQGWRYPGYGARAGVQDARSMGNGSFPLASWLCRMPSPRLHFRAGLAAGDP